MYTFLDFYICYFSCYSLICNTPVMPVMRVAGPLKDQDEPKHDHGKMKVSLDTYMSQTTYLPETYFPETYIQDHA